MSKGLTFSSHSAVVAAYGREFAKTGFVFVDAPRVPDPDQPDVSLFLPDESGLGSIVALYNEPATVFDVPRMALKSSVYVTRG